ncbi:MAG: MerR family DNA-binding transcriptional regulator, partial [Nitrospinales bacterium]
MKTMTISKIAKEAGVGVETVRFYERKGLVDQPPKP